MKKQNSLGTQNSRSAFAAMWKKLCSNSQAKFWLVGSAVVFFLTSLALLFGLSVFGLLALVVPGFFEEVGIFFLHRIPSLFVALPMGFVFGGLLALAVFFIAVFCGIVLFVWNRKKRRQQENASSQLQDETQQETAK